jgi:hypothetical protein
MTEFLPPDKIRSIVQSVATANIGSQNIKDFMSQPTTDVEGNPALQITIILASEAVATTMAPNAALNTLVQVHDGLLKEGDERFPFIRYVTPEDLEANGQE